MPVSIVFRPSMETRKLIDPPGFTAIQIQNQNKPLSKEESQRMRNLARRIRGLDPLPSIQE